MASVKDLKLEVVELKRRCDVSGELVYQREREIADLRSLYEMACRENEELRAGNAALWSLNVSLRMPLDEAARVLSDGLAKLEAVQKLADSAQAVESEAATWKSIPTGVCPEPESAWRQHEVAHIRAS